MSGICGWFAPGPTASPSDQIEAMARALQSPLTGQIVQRNAANHALAVIAPRIENGSLYQDDVLWVACEGTPYFNEAGLMKLSADRGPAAALADNYRRKGRLCLQDIHGAFSVAIYDLNTQQVLLAVDRIGIRPLCLTQIEGGVVFGATTDSVTAHPAVSNHLDPQALYDYLYFHMIPSPRTIYTGVEKLMPGQFALLENGRIRKEFYWRMEYRDTDGTPQQQLAEEFRGLLRTSVRRALSQPATKIGNFLSGGTDSSTLAGIVTEITGHPQRPTLSDSRPTVSTSLTMRISPSSISAPVITTTMSHRRTSWMPSL